MNNAAIRRIGAALEDKPFRYFLAGSFLSNIGSWMQAVAQAWLMLEISNSAFYLGLDGFANTIPLAVFAFWGGVIADRVDRRRLLIQTQCFHLVLALLLGILAQLHLVRIWHILLFSFFTGLTQAVAWPVYQAVLGSIVDRCNLSNAIALNSMQFNLARTIGPVAGAFGMHWFGPAGCFYANAVSFIAVIWALLRIRIPPTEIAAPIPKSMLHSLREGLAAMAQTRALLWLLVLLAFMSIFGVPLVTLLPLYARDILKIGASGLGGLVGSFGAGAVLGAFAVAYQGNMDHIGRFVLRMVFLFTAAMLIFAYSRATALSMACLFVAGFSMVGSSSVINTLVQTSVPDHLRGRAVSLFVFAFGGCMPLGNLLAGFLAKTYGAPAALLGQGAVLGAFVIYLHLAHKEVHALA